MNTRTQKQVFDTQMWYYKHQVSLHYYYGSFFKPVCSLNASYK